jgi:hypothetical protein
MKANEACMARWSRQCRLLAVAIVALLCSAFDAHAFALCDDFPDLFAGTPIAQQAALPQWRLQRAPLHDRYASRWHQTRDDRLPHWLVFGAETVGSTASQPIDEAASSAATPALRIDAFFNLVSMGATDQTDQTEQAAALRTSVQGQLPIGQGSPSPNGGTGFLLPVLIAVGSILLVGAVLIAGSHIVTLPAYHAGGARTVLLSARARRLIRGMSGTSLEGSTVPLGAREWTAASRPNTGGMCNPAGHG